MNEIGAFFLLKPSDAYRSDQEELHCQALSVKQSFEIPVKTLVINSKSPIYGDAAWYPVVENWSFLSFKHAEKLF